LLQTNITIVANEHHFVAMAHHSTVFINHVRCESSMEFSNFMDVLICYCKKPWLFRSRKACYRQ